MKKKYEKEKNAVKVLRNRLEEIKYEIDRLEAEQSELEDILDISSESKLDWHF